MQIITVPFGYLMSFLYGIAGNYGIAIVLFTIVIKALLLPLSYKQQKSSMKMTALNPQLQELQKKYKNDKEKLNKETMDLYNRHGANPLAGCLPTLLQFPIMIGLYQVINRPLTYMYHLTAEQVSGLRDSIADLAANTPEIILAQHLTEDVIRKNGLSIPVLNLNFFGLNLAQVPNWQVLSVLWIIPLLAALASYGSSKFAQKLQPATNTEGGNPGQTMMMIMPFMSLFFCFQLPAGVGFYWIMTSLTSMLQQWILTKYFRKDYKVDESKITDGGKNDSPSDQDGGDSDEDGEDAPTPKPRSGPDKNTSKKKKR